MKTKKTKKKVSKKNEKDLEYAKKIKQLKEDYGVDFNIKYSKGKNIKTIEFYNLEYKNYVNLRITYFDENKRISSISYEMAKLKNTIKVNSIKKAISEIEKEYQLPLIMSEIDNAYEELLTKNIKDNVNNLEENDKELEIVKNAQISKNN